MSSLSSSEMSGKTLGDVWDVIRASGMSSGHRDIKDVIRDVGDIIGDVGEDIGEDGEDMSSLAFWGRHIFPFFFEMSGKSCLPYLP